MENNKLNKTYSSLQGAYMSQPRNPDNQPAYKSKEKSNFIYEDLNNSKNLAASEAASLVNQIKFRKIPLIQNLQKPIIAEMKENQNQKQNHILKNNFLNSFASEKEKNLWKKMPVPLKGSLNNYNNNLYQNHNNTSSSYLNLNNSILNSSALETSIICNRGSTDKSESGCQKASFTANLPMHVNSISITSKNTKAQVYTSDFNNYIIGVKKNKRTASSVVYANNAEYSRSKKPAYSNESSEKRNNQSDYISNNTDNTSKKSYNDNEDLFKENTRSNNRSLSLISGQNQGQAYRGNQMSYTSNAYAYVNPKSKAYAYARSKEGKERNKELNKTYAAAGYDKDFSDDNLSSDVSEHKRKSNIIPNLNFDINNLNRSKKTEENFASFTNPNNNSICYNGTHNNNFKEDLSIKDAAKSQKTKSKEQEFVIENQNLFNEISGLNLSNNVNNITFMSNNNNTENLINDFNLQKHLSFDMEKANENLINFDEYNLFEKSLNERITVSASLREVTQKLNENSAFNQKTKVYFNNLRIEQDENFRYKKFLDDKFPPTYKSFFSMKLDNNAPCSSLATDDSDEAAVKNKKLNALNSGKFNSIIFKRPSDVFEKFNFALFAEKLENCACAPLDSFFINPAFYTVLNTIISKFPYLIYRIFRTNLISYSGYYEFILFINKKWQIIYVDDFLPYENKAKAFYGTSQIWQLLLEKAIAKASGGFLNYMLLEAHTLFNLITGLNSVILENTSFDLFNYVLDCVKNNFCLCAKYPNFTNNSNSKNNYNKSSNDDVYLAIVDAYEILDKLNDKNNYKIIKLRKPNENFCLEFEIKSFDFIMPKNKLDEKVLQEILSQEAFDTFGYIYVKYFDFKAHFDNLYCCMTFVNDENLKKSKRKNNVLTFNSQKEAEEVAENIQLENKKTQNTRDDSKNNNNESEIKHLTANKEPEKEVIENNSNNKKEKSKEELITPLKKEYEVVKGFINSCFSVEKQIIIEEANAGKKENLLINKNENSASAASENFGNRRFSYLEEEKKKNIEKEEEKPAAVPVNYNEKTHEVKKEIAKPKRKGSHEFGPEKADIESEDEKKPSAAQIAKEREAFKAKFQSEINKANKKESNVKPIKAINANLNEDKKSLVKVEDSSFVKPNIENNNIMQKAADQKIIIKENSEKDSSNELNNTLKNNITNNQATAVNNRITNSGNLETETKKSQNEILSFNPDNKAQKPTETPIPKYTNNKNSNNSTNTDNNNQPEANQVSTPVFKKEEKKSGLKKLKEFEMSTNEFKKMEKMKQINEKNAAGNPNKGLTTEQIYENLRKENKKEDLVNNIFSPDPVALTNKKQENTPELKEENKKEDLVASLDEVVDKNKKKKWDDDNKKLDLKRIEEEKRIKEIIEKNEKEYELMLNKGFVVKPTTAEVNVNENNNPQIDEKTKSKIGEEKEKHNSACENADNKVSNSNCDLNASEYKDKQEAIKEIVSRINDDENKHASKVVEQHKSINCLSKETHEKKEITTLEDKSNILPGKQEKEKQIKQNSNETELLEASSANPNKNNNMPENSKEKPIISIELNETEINKSLTHSLEKKASLQHSIKEIIDLTEFKTEFSEVQNNCLSAFKYFKDYKPIVYKGEKFIDKLFPPEIETFLNIEKYILKSPLNRSKRTPSLFSNSINIINSINDANDNSKVKEKLLFEIKLEDIVFKRASEVLDNATVINKGIENLELTKSEFEQCLYCVLSVLANTPQIIFSLIRTLEKNDYGYYELNLFIDGIWQIFFVDDFFPFSVSENKFIGYANIDDQLWPMLLEKAFAKAFGGYYEMYCTDCSKFLSAFTGMESGHVKIIKNDIFEFVLENIKKKSILISNTKDTNSSYQISKNNSASKIEAENANTLKAAYYYVILDAFEVLDKSGSKISKIIKIGSPWEKVEFEGEWSPGSSNWDEALKKKYLHNTTKTKYGSAFLTIDEFVKNFDTVFFSLNNLNFIKSYEGSQHLQASSDEAYKDSETQAEFAAENIKTASIYREDKDCFAMKSTDYLNNQAINSEFTKRFSDPFFPANKYSLLSFSKEANDIVYENARVEYEAVLKAQKYENIVWRRISEVESLKSAEGAITVMEDVTQATKWTDVFDQSPTDSYFQTLIACLVKKPSFIDKLIRMKKINKFCYYEVLLYIDSSWKIVFVDDFVPYDLEKDEFFGVRPYQSQVWPLILQKAWAKACGGYLNMNIMNPTSCFTALTGFESGLYETAKIDLFQFVYDSLKNGYFLMVKSKREHSSLGLQSNFYYIINNCFETNQNGHFFRLLKLRAPWKGFDWSGQWAVNSPIWEEDKRQIMWKKSVYAKNGFFILNYEEFVNNFDCLFYCFVNMNAKEENKLPNFQLEYFLNLDSSEFNLNKANNDNDSNYSNMSGYANRKQNSSNSVNKLGSGLKRSNSLSANYADLQMSNLTISSSSYFSTTKYITPINGFNKYDNSAETLSLVNPESYYFWNLEARSTSNILDILISNSNKRKKNNHKTLNFRDTLSGVKAPKAHLDFVSSLLKTIQNFRSSAHNRPASQDEKNLIRLLQEEENLVANLLFGLEPGSPLDSQWYFKELKNNGVWLSQYDIGNQHIAFHAVKKHIRMGIYKGNLQWGKSIIFDFFYEDENSNFFYSFDGVNIDGQKQGEGKYFKKSGFTYNSKEIVELSFNNDFVQTGKFLMPDGCVWTGPVKNLFYKGGTGTIKTPEGISWQCTYNMDTFIK